MLAPQASPASKQVAWRGHYYATRGRLIPRPCKAAAAAAAPETSVAAPAAQPAAQRTAEALRSELKNIFNTGTINRSLYSSNVIFEDPISRFTDITGYSFMIKALTTLFKVTFDLLDLEVSQPDLITTRWSMTLQVWELPWQPTLLFSGRSFYKLDPVTGVILEHRDVWDSVDNNSYLSPEAAALVVRQLLDLQQTPKGLETPQFRLLLARRDYEVRLYDPYIVAEAPMAPGSTPAGGSGFNDLAGYIFGGNAAKEKMEMTTPVFTQPPPAGSAAAAPSMQFVLERKFGDVSQLPAPNNPAVVSKQVQGSYKAAVRFSGLPFDWDVAREERALRAALLRDGLRPAAGYKLARYNEPFVPPFLRRNEVIIDLEDFALSS